MTWLTYRQHRQQALFGAAALALIAVFLLVTGVHMSSAFHAGLSRCLAVRGHGNCGDLEGAFESRFGTLRQLVPFFMGLPLLAGLFWGAPLVARELEQGTHRLVWTQGIGRLRWLSAKLVALVGLTLALAVAYAALITWWIGPLNSSTGDRFQPGVFDQQGVVPVAYALFAVALGIAAGTVLGRTMPAMAVTLVGFVGLRLVVAGLVRRHFVSAVTMKYVPVPGADVTHPGAWVFSQRTYNGFGRLVSPFDVASTCPPNTHPTTAALDRCVRAHGFLNVDVIEPAHRFWLFQGIEGGLYAGLAVALLALTVWWVRRRLA